MLIAIAGGICSGKSEVSGILRRRGETVLVADEINAELLTDANYLVELATAFPTVFSGGIPDKHKLKELIFNDKNARMRLNGIAHPAILSAIRSKAKASGKPVVFVEIPLLVESGARGMFDRIWVVNSPDNVRTERIMQRDGLGEESAKKILLAQQNESSALGIADEIIVNDGTLNDLEAKVEKLLKEVKSQ